MAYTTFSLVRLFSNYKAFYQNSPNVCIQQVWWQKQAPSPILLENVRFMVVAFFAGRFLNTTTIYSVVLCLDYYLVVLGWHIALGPTKSLTNVAQNLAQLIVNSIYAGTNAA